jgi:hypothetical protein
MQNLPNALLRIRFGILLPVIYAGQLCDIRTIQGLLGHSYLRTTMIYNLHGTKQNDQASPKSVGFLEDNAFYRLEQGPHPTMLGYEPKG